MKYMLILLLLLNSCVIKKNKVSNKQLDLNFNEEMTFEEFKIKLEEYSNNSPYPNINN
ncbi:hypothetical protein HIMB5_00006840 [alpha proteobacterium HIMB5]|jgi:hypothetical protein|nr:hypothetical protein HIMB5_00006840 [alpha proteobacterium HIMB5]|tara:strand:+ start:516 stop:689 length:174 start_codon:yes stop_codon:yes gene_type:complete